MPRRSLAALTAALAAALAAAVVAALAPALPRAAAAQPAARTAAQTAAQTAGAAERAQVLAAVDTLFHGMRTKDAALMRQQLDSLARLTLLRPARDGGGVRVVVLTGEEFVRGATAAGQPGIDEPIRNPVVHVDGDLATVWAEYQVRRDGRVSHCGYDALQLVRRQGRWRVLAVADTYRTAGCGAPW